MATGEIYKLKPFLRFAEKERIDDAALREAIDRADSGLIDADLGGGVVKQRIARANEGRSGGFRTIVLFRHQERAFFAYGFAKNDRENISKTELADFRKLAERMLSATDDELRTLEENGALTRVEKANE